MELLLRHHETSVTNVSRKIQPVKEKEADLMMIRTGITHVHALQETRLSLVALITSSPVVPAPLMISLAMKCERKNSNVDGIPFNS